MPKDPITIAAIRRRLHTKVLGQKMQYFDTLPSTNDTLKQMTDAIDGTVVIAGGQTAGKGTKGRSFYSPENDGVYCSVLLRRPLSPEKVGLLTCAAAVAVAQAIETLCPVSVGVKWVNDLLINGKKVCGILTEGVFDPETGLISRAVIGIGINVHTNDFPADISLIASSLWKESGITLSRGEVIATVLNELEKVVKTFESGAFLEEYKRRSVVLGKEITVIKGAEQFTAKAIDINLKGELLLENEQGVFLLASGDVSIKI